MQGSVVKSIINMQRPLRLKFADKHITDDDVTVNTDQVLQFG